VTTTKTSVTKCTLSDNTMGLSVALFISVSKMLLTKRMVSYTTP
jgi:hypothetical protein